MDDLIKSYPINLHTHGVSFRTISFSPVTYKVSTITSTGDLGTNTLSVNDLKNSNILFQEEGPYTPNHLSPDGSLLVASGQPGDTCVWKCSSNQGYALWRKFLLWGNMCNAPRGYQFSPTS